MFIVSWPIRCETKPQKITDKLHQGSLSSTRNLQFSLCVSLKKLFLPQTNKSHLISSIQKANYRIDLKVSANCENLQRYRFASWVKSQLQKIWIKNHQSQPTSMTLTAHKTNTEEDCLWLAHFFSFSDALT